MSAKGSPLEDVFIVMEFYSIDIMKNLFSAAVCALCAASVISCGKETVPFADGETVVSERVYVEFNASLQSSGDMSPESKTSLSGKSVFWSENDAVSVFSLSSANAGGERFDAISVNGKNAVFGGNIVPSDIYLALYPYQETAEYSDGILKAELPVGQIAVENGFADNTNLAAAVSSGDAMIFRNLCSVVKFTLSEECPTFVSAGIRGANDEPIAGDVTITMPVSEDGIPAMTVDAGGSPSVTLSGNMSAGKTYCFVLAPVTMQDGFELFFTDSEGKRYTLTGHNPLTLERSGIISLQTITPEAVSSVAIIDEAGLRNWFESLSEDPSSTAVLERDVTLAGDWTPAAENGFTGLLDGNGKIISGLDVSVSSDFAGLFASVMAGGTVRDLTLEIVGVTTSSATGSAGAIAGFSLGIIENCVVRPVSGTATVSAPTYSGGIVGNNSLRVWGCTVENVNVTTSGSSGAAGGICGVNHGNIENCTVSSSVFYATGLAGNAGAVAGHNSRLSESYSGYISDCNVSGTEVSAVNAGILVGTNEGSGFIAGIYGSSARNSIVSGLSGRNSRIGGIVGYASRSETVDCHADNVTVGNDVSAGSIGGFVGYCYNSSVYGCSAVSVELEGNASGDGGKGAIAGYNGGIRGSGIISSYYIFKEGADAAGVVGTGSAPVSHCIDGSTGNYQDLVSGVPDFADAFGNVWKASVIWRISCRIYFRLRLQ